ncbi:unnamed protein product, partial [Cyprideis torosa]
METNKQSSDSLSDKTSYVRVKLLQVELNDLARETGRTRFRDPYCVVTLKEPAFNRKKGMGRGVELVQRHRSMNPEWNQSFDAPVRSSLLIHLVVMDRLTQKIIADLLLGTQVLADKCRNEEVGDTWIYFRRIQYFGGVLAAPVKPSLKGKPHLCPCQR